MSFPAGYKQEAFNGNWRSEDMELYSLIFQREAAYATIKELGRRGIAQLRDLNPDVAPFDRPYMQQIRRCDGSERILRYFHQQLANADATGIDYEESEAHRQSLNFDGVESKLQKLEQDFSGQNADYEQLLTQENFLRGNLEVLRVASDSNLGLTTRGDLLATLVGVIPIDKFMSFTNKARGITRGNATPVELAEIQTPFLDVVTREKVYKKVVSIAATPQVIEKIRKFGQALDATFYDLSEIDMSSIRGIITKAEDKLKDHKQVMEMTSQRLAETLSEVSSNINEWGTLVAEEKAIYEQLNYLRFNPDTAVAEAWAPLKDELNLQEALRTGAHEAAAIDTVLQRCPTNSTRPTFYATNKFTQIFQSIVDSYGLARYKEINPAAFTIITFPFLFGVMYGDFGHGMLMTVIAAFLVIRETSLAKIDGEIFQMIFGGRYLLLLMGLFSTYQGIMYNDCFGLMLQLFGRTNFEWGGPANPHSEGCMTGKYLSGHPGDENCTYTEICPEDLQANDFHYGDNYPIGIDPGWAEASNRLNIMNSIKMKNAVILGVLQMLVGVFLGGMNYIWVALNEKESHNRLMGWVKFFTMFIPEVLFLSCTFGYMDLMIIIKWMKDWTIDNEMWNPNGQYSAVSHLAPSILQTMTDFFLHPGSVPQGTQELRDLVESNTTSPQFPHYESAGTLFAGQFEFQMFLLLVAVACVPVLFCVVPCVKYFQMKKLGQLDHQQAEGGSYSPVHHPSQPLEEGEDPEAAGAAPHAAENIGDHAEAAEGHDFSEVVIDQVIHTIEYVLGCVSNTASYLRLWALSLAHAQLSEVFWNFTMFAVFDGHYGMVVEGVMFFFVWPVWFAITFAVLLMMEGLSAFLHALRLHWVEFQNKFYKGDGEAFIPFVLPTAPTFAGVVSN